jgi:methylated-DNA-[protein]-cysteine S-methyltransferase
MLAIKMSQSKHWVPDDVQLWRIISSPIGPILVVVSEVGVQHIDFLDETKAQSLLLTASEPLHPILQQTLHQLSEYFVGSRAEFELPLDLGGTDFQREAWLALARIPFGRTATYAEQAASIGRPRAVRAIGVANSKNPVAIVLPCHRVIGADGSLTGYAGGIDKKKWLLDHERSR